MTRLFACACIGLSLTSPALAQQSDATDGLGSVASENPFGRDRNVSVLERDRPDYSPEPIHIGIVEMMPRIAVGAGYDDNLFASRDDRVDDFYVRIRPRVSFVRPSPNLRLTASGELDLLRYADRSTENATQYNVGAGALYTISNDTSFDLRAVHGRYSEERVSPDSPTGVVEPNRFTITQGTATATHVFNRLRIRGVLDIENRNYRDGRTPSGAVVDQDFRDRTTYTVTGIGEYALNPSVSLFAAGSYNERDYKLRQDGAPTRDSRGFDLAAGASFELGRKMRGSLRLGYLSQDYGDPAFEDISGVLVRGELAYFLTSLVTITGTVDRSISETGVAGATSYLKTTATLRADYELLRNLILSAGADLETRDFAGIDRNDDRWTYRANATWLLSRRISLRADFQRRTQSSSGAMPGREFGDNRVSVGISFSGL